MREGENTTMHCVGLIQECCSKVYALLGDAAEIGVYRGQSAKLICEMLPTCTVHLYDTLAGIPDQCLPDENVRPGDFHSTSLEIVEDALKFVQNYQLHVGVFPATAVDMPLKFVHVDCDIYQSTKDAVAWGWKNLVPGGLMLCDDYGACECGGARRAIDEFRQAVPTAGWRRWSSLAVISKEARDGN